jgi:predicted DsbA family dithiol-disulfide isomerase
LHPDTPEEGLTLEQLFAGRNFDLDAAQRKMAALMRQEGLEYGQRSMTYNSRLAQELACWAELQAGGSGIHDALFRAYFVDNVNLARRDNLVAIAASVGLDEDAARDALETRAMRAAVDEDWRRSRTMGVTGVPTFVCAGRVAVGAQPFEAIEQMVVAAGGKVRG